MDNGIGSTYKAALLGIKADTADVILHLLVVLPYTVNALSGTVLECLSVRREDGIVLQHVFRGQDTV